jgi:hypothetical protein
MALSLRHTAARHPDAFLMLLQRPVMTEAARLVRDAVYESLREAGVSEELIPRVERLLSTYTIGFAASEAAGRFAMHDPSVLDADFEWGWTRLLAAFAGPAASHDVRSSSETTASTVKRP